MAEYKQWREEKRTYLKDVVPLDAPYNIKVEVSSLCNLKCVYCAHSVPNHGVYQGNMSMEIFEKILQDVEEFNTKPKLMEMYMFGEPLCNPNLAKMIKMAKDKKIAERVEFTTNGLLFTKQNIDEIISAGTDVIRISLQGLDEETYWRTCGVHINFNRFLENLKYLYEHKKNCQIRMKIADIALKDKEKDKVLFTEMFGKIADRIFIEHILPLYGDVNYDEEINNSFMCGRENVKTTYVHKVCHRPFYRVRIAADGMVTSACCDTPHDIVYGDIKKESLKDIWNGKKHNSFLKMQLEGKRFFHPSCKGCVAANDITTEADILDPYAEEILKRM